ncbi:MAG: patatin-like phospholipase family protein [Enhydrobacter sp.]|nr:patatin-like phospholipase family protein [Enhydrobacter sp.]
MANDQLRPGVAFALSGGGFRATLFHIGALIRLNELGILPTLDRISAVSGGSITAGMLACRWEALKAGGFTPTDLDRLVTQPLRKFCTRNIDVRAIAEGSISPWNSISDVVEREYDELFDGTRLPSLPDRPRTIFNTTNLQTGRDLRISKPYLADYRIGRLDQPDLSVAKAVAASSAFPPVLSPCIIEVDPAKWQREVGADLFDDARYKHTLSLTDGGAYDNIGLEPVDNFETILVSDAGAPFGLQGDARIDALGQLSRALDIATDQARGLRARYLIELAKLKNQKVAYWGIDTRYDKYPAAGKLPCDPARTNGLKDIRTRLNAFDKIEQETLINWGYALTDAAMRSFVLPDATPPAGWPCPTNPLS